MRVYLAWKDERPAASEQEFEALCAEHPSLVEELRAIRRRDAFVEQMLGASLLGDVGYDEEEALAPDVFERVLERLRRRRPDESRYEERGEIGSGGMGSILELFDVDLRRPVAKKVVRNDPGDSGAQAVDARVVGRFLEEAQITAQLSHPGVVPVHELGIDESGRVFFTMDLVRGRTLQEVFDLARAEAEGWSVTRAVTVLERVCETLAYAHSRGVIHRDIKPGNVMVGEFGEVYVMDWGLARILDRERPPEVAAAVAPREVSTDRRDASSRDTFAALRTAKGTAAGTPGFMAPEQARGEIDRLDARTDVYALGALLYTLLAGLRPYEREMRGDGLQAMFDAMRAGEFQRIHDLMPAAAPELVSIAERAMATEPADRYESGVAMAADLRAWLEGRVVSAHERGAWAELRKWVRRNRGLAAAIALVFVAISGGAAGMAAIERNGRIQVEEEQALGDVKAAPTQAAGLLALSDELWPATPDVAPALREWLDEKAVLDAGRPLVEEGMAAIRGDSERFEAESFSPVLARRLEALVEGDQELELAEASVRERLSMAEFLRERTVESAAALDAWAEASASIAASDVYDGLEVVPQLGLLPLGENPRSGLWEFWHVLSGEEPVWSEESSRWVIEESSGIVLVLLPALEDTVGAPYVDESHELFDEYAVDDWQKHWPATHDVSLDPFFLSKYELTQGQWMRVMGRNDSQIPIGNTHPADTVSWDSGVEVLRRLDLQLPTEAQWEVAARAGGDFRFYTGRSPATLRGHANIKPDADLDGAVDVDQNDEPSAVFGFDWNESHLPVGSGAPNPFGLYDIHGNVWEWCRDVFVRRDAVPRPGDGLRGSMDAPSPKRVMRGGSYSGEWPNARVTLRYVWERQNREPDVGVRPARALRPAGE